ncbi:hypothetical protein N7474_001946 [Penicillium riverlandense]|uniref:uncharacterized protein n=1 Tax=Penicillium riverlandense TaxID=1903569 RepID=UPI002547CA6E|nr:uncharacterized protein N7474_001946 [Penicillium riverlandense]KAJ5833635.1 hypothetical protein N7474_001946 [Penicillium riverlandense]
MLENFYRPTMTLVRSCGLVFGLTPVKQAVDQHGQGKWTGGIETTPYSVTHPNPDPSHSKTASFNMNAIFQRILPSF